MKLVYPPSGQIGVQVLDTEVTEVTLLDVEQIKQLVYDYKLVIFRNQSLDNLNYLEFAQKIGVPRTYPQDNYHRPKCPNFFVNSEVFPQEVKKSANLGIGGYWQTDCAFLEEPFSFTILYPNPLPNSALKTYFIDMEQVYQNLPVRLKSYVDGKRMIHEGKWRYKVQQCDMSRTLIDIMREIEDKYPAVSHPSVVIHPVTGARILYMSSGFTTGIEGIDYETSQANLQELFAFIERDEHIYHHIWQEGDMLLWENRTLNHKIWPVAAQKNNISYRIGIYDGLPFYYPSVKETRKTLVTT